MQGEAGCNRRAGCEQRVGTTGSELAHVSGSVSLHPLLETTLTLGWLCFLGNREVRQLWGMNKGVAWVVTIHRGPGAPAMISQRVNPAMAMDQIGDW